MKFILLSFAFLCTFSLSAQQVIGFEDRVPEEFTSPDKKSLSLSNRYYKEGKKSLEWNFVPGSTMYVALDAPLVLNNKTEARPHMVSRCGFTMRSHSRIHYALSFSMPRVKYPIGLRTGCNRLDGVLAGLASRACVAIKQIRQ